MAVVINDFEVVTAPPQGQPQQAQPPQGQGQPAPAKQAAELEKLIRRRHERAARVRAH